LSLLFTQYHVMKTYPVLNQAPYHEGIWRSEGKVPHILTLAFDGGECSVSCPGHFTPGELGPGYPTAQKAGWAP